MMKNRACFEVETRKRNSKRSKWELNNEWSQSWNHDAVVDSRKKDNECNLMRAWKQEKVEI